MKHSNVLFLIVCFYKFIIRFLIKNAELLSFKIKFSSLLKSIVLSIWLQWYRNKFCLDISNNNVGVNKFYLYYLFLNGFLLLIKI